MAPTSGHGWSWWRRHHRRCRQAGSASWGCHMREGIHRCWGWVQRRLQRQQAAKHEVLDYGKLGQNLQQGHKLWSGTAFLLTISLLSLPCFSFQNKKFSFLVYVSMQIFQTNGEGSLILAADVQDVLLFVKNGKEPDFYLRKLRPWKIFNAK